MAAAAISLAGPAQADDYDYTFKNTVTPSASSARRISSPGWRRSAVTGSARGVDGDPYKSANFVQHNLPRGTTEGQAFQFLGAAIDHYCPDEAGFLQAAGH